ncbi:ImmA/IrrE family metallo-endopeptidase [Clostridium coskatii]|uniref:IrrE N-terminal-like domain-containing protein n=1 Tax=Clostridium coskatii TaxID=1705578 RepID=A0A168MS72_9CLOT|nr:ImmA/IrrE family metallo-endopeptidase [Clostridium coskatii]OAA85089.1 hypothetical protein WX73_03261 [Clostridium coskatii]OBR90245.1 hypothetical protein CLCOS_40790 [Clostridium coskatii]
MDKLNDSLNIGYERAINFRDKYGLGNYCGKNLLDILSRIEEYEKISLKLIRTHFSNLKLAGFIGYKNNTYIIVTNSNQTLGKERFTIAHEIYHLLENRVYLKKKLIIEQPEYNDENIKDINEKRANAFAAELLMPKEDIDEYLKKISIDKDGGISELTIIEMQNLYGVDHTAVTKRLIELNLIDDDKQKDLEKILKDEGKLESLTKNLGYDNKLNTPSKVKSLSAKDLQLIKSNYDNGYIDYNDLVVIFGYLGCQPEDFGYEQYEENDKNANDFINNLLS